MSARRVVGAVAAFGMVGAGGLVIGGAAAPALAFTGTCPTTTPAATLVADNVCQVVITTSQTFTPPSGITKLAAVLVAGGGGSARLGDESYAGSGGSVTYVDSVPLGSDVTVTVGLGGVGTDSGPLTAGGDTTIGGTTAAGGATASPINPFCSDVNGTYVYGNGAQTPAQGTPGCAPGAGFSLSQLAGVDPTLFPASADGTTVYGNGGAATAEGGTLPPQNDGSGGSASFVYANSGEPGVVIFRFALPPTLAATGVGIPWSVPAISGGIVALGALLLALRRRRVTE